MQRICIGAKCEHNKRFHHSYSGRESKAVKHLGFHVGCTVRAKYLITVGGLSSLLLEVHIEEENIHTNGCRLILFK